MGDPTAVLQLQWTNMGGGIPVENVDSFLWLIVVQEMSVVFQATAYMLPRFHGLRLCISTRGLIFKHSIYCMTSYSVITLTFGKTLI